MELSPLIKSQIVAALARDIQEFDLTYDEEECLDLAKVLLGTIDLILQEWSPLPADEDENNGDDEDFIDEEFEDLYEDEDVPDRS